jgi:nucleoside-diphosphate kinase
MAEEFYAEHKGKPFYPGLVEFMTSGPIFALVLAKASAIKAWRELMGPTDVFEARVRAPKR